LQTLEIAGNEILVEEVEGNQKNVMQITGNKNSK